MGRANGTAVVSRTLVLYLASRFCTAAALTMFRAAVAWHVFALTNSAFHLGLIGLVQFVPALGVNLVGGAVADTYDRRRIMLRAQLVPLLAGASLYTVTRAGVVDLPILYGLIFLVAVAAAFDNPARAALLPTLVPREVFPRVVTIASTVQALAFATGPAVGGFVIAGAGIAATYAIYACLIGLSLVGLAFLRPPPSDTPRASLTLAAVREGLAFVRGNPVVLGCMTLDMFAVIFGGATALLPIYAHEILRVGARGYGVLSAALEVGALCTSIVLLWLPPLRHAGRALLVAVGVFGAATIVFGLSRSFPLSVLAYMAVGVADQVSVVMRSTIIQLATPDVLRGRVSAVNFIFIGASNQLGAVESGFVAALTTATFSVVSGGLGCLAVVALVATRLPALRHYRIETAPSSPPR